MGYLNKIKGVQKMVRRYLFLAIILFGGIMMIIFAQNNSKTDKKVRKPAVAGSFYPGDSAKLSKMITQLLNESRPPQIEGTIIGLISPHAGYVYSGHVAASGYQLLKNQKIKRVIVISPSHIIAFNGSSVYNGSAYQTPLGEIPVDISFCRQLTEENPSIQLSEIGHDTQRQGRMEHALEVQLPFLQHIISDFSLVPIIMGDQDYESCRTLGNALANLIKDDETIIVASSDLSHFHPYDEAVKLDDKIVHAVEEWDHINLSRNLNRRVWEACGGGPIVATMIAMERLGANQAKVIKYANSGDVHIGDKNSVVGYMSAVFYRDSHSTSVGDFDFSLSEDEQNHLMTIAKKSVETAVANGKIYECTSGGFKSLELDRGAFVTLNKGGHLRGCIGYTSAVQPLYETVRSAAISAALKDPRFPAVSTAELSQLHYEISVLSPFQRVYNMDHIKVGKHGLMVKKNQYEGLLLPQVATDNHWNRTTFLEQTCRKAGLPLDAWKDEDTDIFVFSAFVFSEEE
jgi:AmmeMemoRadiSam system protein B/AmmeMemoRadiSam system protein A